jgi:hypothetical protein
VVPAALTPPVTMASSRLRRRWTTAFVIGELVGFVPPAVTGAVLGAADAPDAVLVAGLTLAGLAEGAALGTAQRRVLRDAAPAVDGQRWVLATTLAAGFAWLVGMGGGALLGSGHAGPWLLALLVPGWVTALVGMGGAQWLVLRRAVARSARWVPVTAGAWLAGVPIPVVALSTIPNGWPAGVRAVVGVLAAVAMGAVVGSLTGRTLARLLDPASGPVAG